MQMYSSVSFLSRSAFRSCRHARDLVSASSRITIFRLKQNPRNFVIATGQNVVITDVSVIHVITIFRRCIFELPRNVV